MRRTAQLAALFFLFTAAAPPPAQKQSASGRPAPARKAVRPKAPVAQRAKRPEPPPAALPCGDLLSFQVLLDRQGFSPGQIDDKTGPNLTHALAAMQRAHGLQATGAPDCESWTALGGDTAGELLADYTIGDEDMKGPFEPRIPRELVDQAALPALSYRTPLERLGERFHASPLLLQRLNANMTVAAGTTIKVPAVEPFDPGVKPALNAATEPVTVVVSRDDSALRVQRADGSIVFFAPVTTGSDKDPLPIGDWKVTGVQWSPKFHYNPQLFWDAKPQDTKATIPAGPNNPVGLVWIDLNIDHYGLHGTPEPGHIGHTESHGCVRLTNWDAVRVAALVKPGTPVQFR
jgi:lipoprotein-anchoring transpeptidase ErfK/SrfK